MAKKQQNSKEKRINEELEKLKTIFSKIDVNTKKSVDSLVSEAAFMAASLYELREIINEKGYTEYYQNGANQSGIKKCAEVEIYIQLSKNYMSVVKQLTDLLPKIEPPPEDDEFDDFVGGRGD